MAALDLADELEQIIRIREMRAPRSVSLDHFEEEKHPTGFSIVHGGGMNGFLLIGEYKGPHCKKIPRGESLALRVALAFKGLNPSTVTMVRKLVNELSMIPLLPDHTSIVKPFCWFKTHQNLNHIGMYYRYRVGSKTFVPEQVDEDLFHSDTIVVVAPLWEYVLCDKLNKARSFVHCFPMDAAVILENLEEQLIDAVGALKEKNIAHNDIKADNIVVRREANATGGWRAALIDFGEMRQFATPDMILAAGENPPGGAAAYKPPSLSVTRCYKDADRYALECTMNDVRETLSIEVTRRLQRKADAADELSGNLHKGDAVLNFFPDVSFPMSRIWQSRTRFAEENRPWDTYPAELQQKLTLACLNGQDTAFFEIKGEQFRVDFRLRTQTNVRYPDRVRDIRHHEGVFQRWFLVNNLAPHNIHELDPAISEMIDRGTGERVLVHNAVCVKVTEPSVGLEVIVDKVTKKAYLPITTDKLKFYHAVPVIEHVYRILQETTTVDLDLKSVVFKQLVGIFNATKGSRTMTVEHTELAVEKAQVVVQKKLYLQFLEQLQRKPNARVIPVFHGTTPENRQGILQSNFATSRISSRTNNFGWFGKGIYFSEHAFTCLGYNVGQELLVCMVAVEKTFVCPPPNNSANPYNGQPCEPGYDSHYSPSRRELVVFNVKQILPCVVLTLSSPHYIRSSVRDYETGHQRARE